MRRITVATALAALLLQTSLASATPFINEFHYDNAGTDAGEFIELAGGAGWDLSGWSLALYNGVSSGSTSRRLYGTRALSGVFTNQSNGWGFLNFEFPSNGIQNGGDGLSNADPDGFALIDNNSNVVQFLSYEGAFTALDGPAAARASADVGVRELSDTSLGFSVRLTGTQGAGVRGGALGSQPNGFTWAAPAPASPGALNAGQTFTQAPPPPPPPPPGVNDRTIAAIQGAAQRSPEEGNQVRTTGVVSQLASNGYYLQSTSADNDGNASTSEGLFVFTGGAPGVAVGDLVRVTGTVAEFLPGGNANNLTSTQLTGSSFTRLSTGNTVSATILGAGGRTPPVSAIETSSNLADYDPVNAGRDFYESLEGMLVTVRDARAVAPTVFIGGNRELWVRAAGAPTNSLSSRGTLVIGPDGAPNVQRGDFNPERIQIDPAGSANALAQPGDRLGDVTGVFAYNFGNYELIPTTTPSVIEAAALPREVAAFRAGRSRFTYASYNVENLQTGQATRFGELALQVRDRLLTPDVIGLQEIVTDGGNDPAATLTALTDAIRAAGGGDYGFAFLPPAGAQDDRIVNAYLFNRARVGLVAGSLSYVPGTDAAGSAYNDARGPLVAQFTFNGETVTTINNHWSSRGGSQALFGLNQPPINAADDRRLGQGQELNAFVDGLLAQNRRALVVVNGDLNSFYFEDPQLALRGAGADQVLFGLYELLALNERYNYTFDGNGQMLDYIYASRRLFGRNPLFDVVHFNSEYLDGFSDHDPVIAAFLVPAPAAAGLLLLGVAGLVARRRRRFA